MIRDDEVNVVDFFWNEQDRDDLQQVIPVFLGGGGTVYTLGNDARRVVSLATSTRAACA